MTRMKHFALGFAIFVTMLTGAGLAQTTHTPISPQKPPTTTKHQEPCWQQVGISKSALQQRRQIAERAHSEIEAVCNNSSLTAQQKQQQIHQIWEQARAQMNSAVSAQQMSALQSCRAQRGQASTGVHHSGSPCGEMPGAKGLGSSATGQKATGAEKPEEPEE